MRLRHGLAITALLATISAAPAHGQKAIEQEPIEIFDAHMHYNQEPNPFYSLDKIVEIFRRNRVTGVLSTSRPNKGTHQLVEAKPAGLWVVPFIRPYRIRSDIQSWFNDPAIFDLIKDEYRRGYYRGIGEFHLVGKSAATEWVKKTADFAVENNLYLHCHCDDEALTILFGHNGKARVIWAHTGFSTQPARVAQLFEQHPGALWGELSYRYGITDGNGRLMPEWRDLFQKYSDRFLLGSDTWINERWFGYDTIVREYRGWLAQLPADQARRIAHGNAAAIFGPRKPD